MLRAGAVDMVYETYSKAKVHEIAVSVSYAKCGGPSGNVYSECDVTGILVGDCAIQRILVAEVTTDGIMRLEAVGMLGTHDDQVVVCVRLKFDVKDFVERVGIPASNTQKYRNNYDAL